MVRIAAVWGHWVDLGIGITGFDGFIWSGASRLRLAVLWQAELSFVAWKTTPSQMLRRSASTTIANFRLDCVLFC